VSVIPSWLRRYDRGWLAADATAGLTIWALMVPQAMAYAGIAGVPVQNGLYVMPLAVVGYALFGCTPWRRPPARPRHNPRLEVCHMFASRRVARRTSRRVARRR
jgi:hypothetical protein